MASANSAIYEISEPVVEPVSLEEAKNHLRVSSDFTDDDALIRTLIRMARIDAEAKTGGRIFPTREFEWLPDEPMMAGEQYEVPVSPAVGVKIFTESGSEEEIDSTKYKFIKSSLAPYGKPLYAKIVPNEDLPQEVSIVVTAGWPNVEKEEAEVFLDSPTFQPDNTTFTEDTITIQFNRAVTGELTTGSFYINVDENHVSLYDVDIVDGRVKIRLSSTLSEGSSVELSYVSGFLKDKDGNYVMPIMKELLPIVKFDYPVVELPEVKFSTVQVSSAPDLIKTWMLVRVATLYQQRSQIAIQAGKTSNAFFPRDYVNSMLDAYTVKKA